MAGLSGDEYANLRHRMSELVDTMESKRGGFWKSTRQHRSGIMWQHTWVLIKGTTSDVPTPHWMCAKCGVRTTPRPEPGGCTVEK